MTTAIITNTAASSISKEIDEAYALLNEQLLAEIEVAYRDYTDFLTMEADRVAFWAYLEELGIDPEEFFSKSDDAEPEILVPLTFLGFNPRARSMQRCGCRDKAAHKSHGTYEVRKDHGTTARRKQIDIENAGRTSRVKNSNAQKRRAAKLAERSGNPRAIRKLKKLGDLLIGD